MKFLADRETRRQLLTLLVLAAAGGWLGFPCPGRPDASSSRCAACFL